MIHEFEGRTEQEAIDTAVAALGLEQDQFDIELVETQKSGFFNRNKRVTIRVYVHDSDGRGEYDAEPAAAGEAGRGRRGASGAADRAGLEIAAAAGGEQTPASETIARRHQNAAPENDFEHGMVDFVRNTLEKMGYSAEVVIAYREEGKLGLRIESEHSGVLIGRKGRTLDSLQLIANVVAGRLDGGDTKIILDTEGYRSRREEGLVRLAEKVGDEVKRSRRSQLLAPMNPFERRLIHTTLNNVEDIETASEGDGLYKQVRVSYRGAGGYDSGPDGGAGRDGRAADGGGNGGGRRGGNRGGRRRGRRGGKRNI